MITTRSKASSELREASVGSKRSNENRSKHDEQRMAKSKRRKASKHKNGVDFISKMPDVILQLILERLPTTEEVVRTSILSKRWRYLWNSNPCVDIDYTRATTVFKEDKFMQLVDSFLSKKTRLDLVSLRLNCAGCYYMGTVRRWIRAAYMRNVKELDLMFFLRDVRYQCIPLPLCLVTWYSLKVLRLYSYGRSFQLSERTLFQGLEVLELNCVYSYDMDMVEKFLEKCPVLKEFSLIDSSIIQVKPMRISSPKLKTLIIRYKDDMIYGIYGVWCGVEVYCPELESFEYVGPRGPLMFENVDRLRKAVILPDERMPQEITSDLGASICKVLDRVSHVESLSLSVYFIQCLDAARRKGIFPASFAILKTLELATTVDSFTMNVLIQIVRSSPKLESLHLIIQQEQLRTEHWALDEVETWRILTRHLKTVNFLGFNGEDQKCVIARFILEHGNALEKMVFTWHDKVTYHDKSMKFMDKMWKYNKASSGVKLVAVLKD